MKKADTTGVAVYRERGPRIGLVLIFLGFLSLAFAGVLGWYTLALAKGWEVEVIPATGKPVDWHEYIPMVVAMLVCAAFCVVVGSVPLLLRRVVRISDRTIEVSARLRRARRLDLDSCTIEFLAPNSQVVVGLAALAMLFHVHVGVREFWEVVLRTRREELKLELARFSNREALLAAFQELAARHG